MRLIPFVLALFLGLWFGYKPECEVKRKIVEKIDPQKEFPVTENKSFVFIVYAYNQKLWCERALRSIFEQDYSHYRVIFVDDASVDGTYETAQEFILKNNQDEKVILIQNEARMGSVACLYRAVDSCLDKEIVVPLDAKDWLSSPFAIARLNLAYQNPDVWVAFAKTMTYPSYEVKEDQRGFFYAGLFKQLLLGDFFQNGKFASHIDAYQAPILNLAGGRVKFLEDPITFFNETVPQKETLYPEKIASYEPLESFPFSLAQAGLTDIVLFSFDRPLQLYACLESSQRYFSGYENITVLYRASKEPFEDGYLAVQKAFPKVRFVKQSKEDPKHDFKSKLLQIVFSSPSRYILFGVDDIIVKDFVDLSYCIEQMEKTDAYGFYLRMGKNINYCYQFKTSQPVPPSHGLSSGVYAWNFETAEYDWGFPNSLDMTLYRKTDLEKPFKELKYKTPNSLEYNWAKSFSPEKGVGLYFEESKLVNIPMNVVGKTGNPHMNYLNVEELLSKFNQGLKMDIEPLYRFENNSPHADYVPEFVLR